MHVSSIEFEMVSISVWGSHSVFDVIYAFPFMYICIILRYLPIISQNVAGFVLDLRSNSGDSSESLPFVL